MNTDIPLKRCSKCKEYKPANNDNFCNCKKSKDGLRGWCKKCSQEDSRRYKLERKIQKMREKEKTIMKTEGEKECVKCKRILSTECFYKSSSNKDGLRTKCKECMDKENADYKLKKMGERGW